MAFQRVVAAIMIAAAMLFGGTGGSLGAPAPAPSPSPSPSPTPTSQPTAGEKPKPYQPQLQDLPVPPPVELPSPDFVPPDVPKRALTLDEAVRIALVHQANITVAQAGVQAAQGKVQQARAGTLPNLGIGATATDLVASAPKSGGGSLAISTSATAGTGSGSVTGSSSTTGGYTLNATVRQLLFDFNHTRDLVRLALAQERAAFANLSKVQQDLVLGVKQGYFQTVQNIRLVGVQETNVKNQRAHLTLARARYKAGIGLPSDVVVAQTALADSIFNLNQAQNSAAVSRVNLAVQIGVDPRTPIDVTMEARERSIDTSEPNLLFHAALKQRAEILAATAALQATQYALSAARTSNAPNLGVNGTYFQRGQQPTQVTSDSFTVGLQINWSIFDGGLTAGQVKEAGANELSARAQLVLARQIVSSDVAQAYLNMKLAEQRLVTVAVEVQNAEESVRLVTGRYKAGLGTIIELLDSEQSLVTARANQVNAQSAVDQARAQLAHAIGVPLEGEGR